MTESATMLCAPSIKDDDFSYRQALRKKAKKNFKLFYNTIFIESVIAVEGEFLESEWIDRFCGRLQFNTKTCTLAARKHAKTTAVIGYLMWLIFKSDENKHQVADYELIMYSDLVAGEKIKRAKQYIQNNSYFEHIIDLKPNAETLLEYANNGRIVSIKPSGIFSFKRSKHPDGVICDDILKDPEKKLDLTQIAKITQIFEAQITPLPKEGGFLHLVGTSQDESDLLFLLKTRPGWDWEINPAIIDWNKKKVLWPERFSFERLMQIRESETGNKNFMREYQLVPVRGMEGFFTRADLAEITDHTLANYGLLRKTGEPEFSGTVAGYDIGKKRHPSHLSVFDIVQDNEIDYLIQICSIWFDGTDYTDQITALQRACARFGISALYYDNTRAEFEGFAERGELPDAMMPVTMGADNQNEMAADFEKLVSQKRIILLNDERQTRSLLAVDNSLKAPETTDGHGDAFWSNGLAVKGYYQQGTPMLQ